MSPKPNPKSKGKHLHKSEFSDGEHFSPLPDSSFGDRIQQIIMPILTVVNGHPTPLGTGFVIGADGLMMTAAHVIQEAINKGGRRLRPDGSSYDHYELYALYISSERHGPENYFNGGLWPIDQVSLSDKHDVALCWLRRALRDDKPILLPSLRLSPGMPKVGEEILGFGYHSMTASLDINTPRSLTLHYSQRTAFTRGQIEEVYPLKRDAGMMRFPCFRTDARFDSGMSGGPIMNERGSVCGMICGGWGPIEGDPRYISHGAMIWPALGIQMDIAQSEGAEPKPTLLHDLIKSGFVASDESISLVDVSIDENGDRFVSIRSDCVPR